MLRRTALATLAAGVATVATRSTMAQAYPTRPITLIVPFGAGFQLIPYRGTGPAMQDLVANQIQIMVDQSANSLPQVRAGKIKAYAVTAKARSAAAPEIPTAAEAGFPMDVSIWNGLWAPKGTPPEVIAKLNAAAAAPMQDPAIPKRPEALALDL